MEGQFVKFDKMIDREGLLADIQRAAENSKEYTDVPSGTYEVKIERMELVETSELAKNPGMPMVSIWFRILNGEYKNSCIFYNKVIMGTSNDGFMIHTNNEFLRSLKSDIDIVFSSYTQYARLLFDVYEAINGKYEYALKYGENAQGFKTYEIKEVFNVK